MWPLCAALLSVRERASMFHVKRLHEHPALQPDAIASVLAASGVTVTTRQAEMLGMHAALVLEANRVVNLTRITEPDAVVRLHILDSLLPLVYESLDGHSVVDVGSGAGFPGIPLAILGHDVTCCEARKKKAAVIAEISGVLDLPVTVIAQRAEELAIGESRWDVVVMRAVSSLGALMELAAPLLTPGGRLLAMKGVRQAEEEERACKVSAIVGLTLREVYEYSLGDGDEARSLYVYQRTGSPRVALPRRSGLAQTQPLG